MLAAGLALAAGCGETGSGSGGVGGGDTTSGGTQDAADAKAPETAGGDAKADLGQTPETSAPPVCHPVKNEGCTAEQHCSYDQDDKLACLPNGPHGIGEECGDGAGCSVGACVSDQAGKARCSPHCISAATCPAGSDCVGIQNKKWKVCDMSQYTPCNPLTQNCKEAGQACYFEASFVCLNAGKKAKGEACEGSNECQPGYICWAKLCRQICAWPTGSPSCENAGTPCSKLGGGAGYCDE